MKEYLFKKGIHECCYRSKSGGNRRGAMPVPTMQLKKGLPLFPLKICHRGFSFFSVLFGRNDISRLTVKEFLSSVPMRISAQQTFQPLGSVIRSTKRSLRRTGFFWLLPPPRFKYEILAIRRGRTFYTSHRIVLEPHHGPGQEQEHDAEERQGARPVGREVSPHLVQDVCPGATARRGGRAVGVVGAMAGMAVACGGDDGRQVRRIDLNLNAAAGRCGRVRVHQHLVMHGRRSR